MTGADTQEEDFVRIALVGRHNSGKTSLLMHLTGTVQKPVNFPGSSVERGESSIKVGNKTLQIVDLPGIGSLDAVSKDESLTLDYLRVLDGPGPHALCCVLDASKPSIELNLLRHVMTLGHPIVVALNKTDVARRRGVEVDVVKLSARLGVKVVTTNAMKGQGIDELRQVLIEAKGTAAPQVFTDSPDDIVAAVARFHEPEKKARTDRIDALVMNRWLGLPIFATVMLLVFQAVFSFAVPFMGWIEHGQGWLADGVESGVSPGALQSFLVDGLINGVGSILIFLPQIAILLALVSLLESTGYMARAAFILDRPMRRVGLSGRSFVPLMSSFACAVPGILSTRMMQKERDRIATIMVAPLMSCSARLPVYILLIGAFFPASYAGLILFGMYALGIVTAFFVAWILRKTSLKGGSSMFMMELPSYQPPSVRVLWNQVWTGSRDFMVMAGTVIFASSMIIWLLSYYPRPVEIHTTFEQERVALVQSYEAVREGAPGAHANQIKAWAEKEQAELKAIDAREDGTYLEQSYLAGMGKFIQPLFAPAGFDWRTSVGILAAFPARELIIPTMGTLYSIGQTDPGAEEELQGLRAKLMENENFSPLVALALIVFFAYCAQCAGTLAAIKRETRSWKWPALSFTYMTLLAWVAAVLVFQIGSAMGYG